MLILESLEINKSFLKKKANLDLIDESIPHPTRKYIMLNARNETPCISKAKLYSETGETPPTSLTGALQAGAQERPRTNHMRFRCLSLSWGRGQ